MIGHAELQQLFKVFVAGADRAGDDRRVGIGLLQRRVGGFQEVDIAFGIAPAAFGGVHAAAAVPFVPDLIERNAPAAQAGRDLSGVAGVSCHRLGAARITAAVVEVVVVGEDSQHREPVGSGRVGDAPEKAWSGHDAAPPFRELPRQILPDGVQVAIPGQLEIDVEYPLVLREVDGRAEQKLLRLRRPARERHDGGGQEQGGCVLPDCGRHRIFS